MRFTFFTHSPSTCGHVHTICINNGVKKFLENKNLWQNTLNALFAHKFSQHKFIVVPEVEKLLNL